MENKSVTTTIHASVKVAPKIRDTYYSFEYSEDRAVLPDCNLEEERLKLFDDCYNVVSEQIKMTIESK